MDTLRDDLNAAIEEEELDAAEESATEEAGSEESGEADSGLGESEQGTNDSSEEDGDEASEESGGDDEGAAGEKEIPAGINAPIGFDPVAREAWAKVPASVQQAVQKREAEIASTMQGTAEARRTSQHLNTLAGNYAPILAAEGAESPMAAVEGLFKTVAELRMGSPQQKAQRMAALISHYGIDIESLDGALAGVQMPQQQAPGMDQNMSRMLDDRLAPMQAMLDRQRQQEQRTQQSNQAAVRNEVHGFADTAEFIGDVRMDMADLLDLSAKQGRSISLQQAYDKACALNPSVQKVLSDRKLTQGAAGIAGKKTAARGLRANSSSNSGSVAPAGNLRDEISNLWDQFSE